MGAHSLLLPFLVRGMLHIILLSFQNWCRSWNHHWIYDRSLLDFDQMVILRGVQCVLVGKYIFQHSMGFYFDIGRIYPIVADEKIVLIISL
jgi:hypothetical protein